MLWVLAISIALLGYIYAGYPVLIWLLAKFFGKPVYTGAYEGGVSVLIAAHNEAGTLPRKLENLMELAKTEPIREIWIGLDGCTDGTGEGVRETVDCRLETVDWGRETRDGRRETIDHRLETVDWRPETGDPCLRSVVCGLQSPPTVQILEFELRRGKAAVLNDLMAKATQPILVMMDARQRVEAGAISKLLENFADAQVGVVSGALVYETAEGGAQKGAESYWGYEKFIRRCESRFWAVPGATGALYAIRKELCRPIPENTLVDDVLIPMRAVLDGFRCLFEPSARAFDLPSAHFDQEGIRKRRTLAGIWQICSIEPKILWVSSNPIWFQWISHKYLRLFTPFLVLMAIFSMGMMELWKGGVGWMFWSMMAGVLISFLAYFLGGRVQSRILGVLGAFWGVNRALLLAAWDVWRGGFDVCWKP